MVRRRPILSALALSLAISISGFTQESETLNPGSTSHRKKTLGHDSYDLWNRLEGSTISPDGKWNSYGVRAAERNANATLHVQSINSDIKYVVARGESARFTDDSQFVAYLINPDRKQIAAARRGSGGAAAAASTNTTTRRNGPPGRTAAGGSSGEASPDEPKDELEILNLATGAKTRVDRVKSFQMPREAAGWIAYLLEKPKETKAAAESIPEQKETEASGEKKEGEKKEGEKKPKKKDAGTERVLRNLTTSVEFRFPNVVSYAFSEKAQFLVFTTSAVEADKDGVFVGAPGSGDAKQIVAGRGNYKSLVADKAASRVAFLTDRDVPRGIAPPEELIMANERMSSLVKAKDAESLMFTRETFAKLPDLWTTQSDFKAMQRASDANPQQSEYRWGNV